MLPIRRPHRLLAAALVAGLCLAPRATLAETATDTLSLQVTVQESCSLSGTTLNFGTYSSGQQTPLDAEGDITYTSCPEGLLTIALDGGGGGNVNARRLSAGNGDTLAYQLYRNSARSQIWGTGSEAQQINLLAPNSGTVTVYGRIPGGAEVRAGAYTDTVNITMTF